MNKKKKIKVSKDLISDIKSQIISGINNLGMYHAQKPAVIKKGKIFVNDMKVLYYYRNRLKGFGLKNSAR